LYPFLFLLVIHWIMKTCTKQRRNGIQWILNTQLEDLDFADDLVQEKTSELAVISSRVGLNIHKCKTKNLKVNAVSTKPVKLEENEIR